jgi:hypothetical protein
MQTPFLITTSMVEDHYHRWREVLKAVAHHDGFLAGHPTHQGFYADLIDRLKEDPWWTMSPVGRNKPSQFIMWTDVVPEDQFLIWSKHRGIQTPSEFFGPTGFGRLTLRPISNDGVRPWSTADIPEGELKHIETDPNGPDLSGL